jgi:hypothetical protein
VVSNLRETNGIESVEANELCIVDLDGVCVKDLKSLCNHKCQSPINQGTASVKTSQNYPKITLPKEKTLSNPNRKESKEEGITGSTEV